MAREGRQVLIATIAAEAGVGVATLYRRYPDRDALLHALEHRAYALLEEILQQADDAGASGRADDIGTRGPPPGFRWPSGFSWGSGRRNRCSAI
jgi:AcrR family transcriptional regulator